MKRKLSVLFGSAQDGARSRMAKGLLQSIAGEKFEVESAGLEVSAISPLAVKVMNEIGIDISTDKPQKVFDLVKKERTFSYIITVCDRNTAEKYPIFPNVLALIHWDFEDPDQSNFSEDEKLEKYREMRDKIKENINNWMKEYNLVE